jgi:serine/threonine-protein kinase
MPPATVLPWLLDLAAAIDHLDRHDPPLLHGDVKPANAIQTPSGHVVLVDLGSAAASTRSGGTRGYQAPEAGTAEVGPRTVVDLVAGSGLEFSDQGDHELKGVPGTWKLFPSRADHPGRVDMPPIL